MSERAFQTNAADRDQVRQAGRRVKREAVIEAMLCGVQMSTYHGRHFCWTLLERLGVFRSVFVTSSEIYYRAGQQDAGHELMARLIEADVEAYALMETEARARKKRADAETDAAFVSSAANADVKETE